ncbi:hypothetical protein ACHAXH_002077 [Discostella pseudostelligera]
MGVADVYLRDLGNSSKNNNNDVINGDGASSSSSVNGDEAVVVGAEKSTTSLSDEVIGNDDNNIDNNIDDFVDGTMTIIHHEDKDMEGVEVDHHHHQQQQQQQQPLDAAQEVVETSTNNQDDNTKDDENNNEHAETETKFYSLWQRRPGSGRGEQNQGNTDDEDVPSSESNNSNKHKLNSSRGGESEEQEAAARIWREWMISGRKVRGDNNRMVETSALEGVASVESSSSALSSESGVGGDISTNDIATDLEMATATVSTASGDDVEVSKDNGSDEKLSPTSPSSTAAVPNGEENSNSTVVMTTTTTTSLSNSSSTNHNEVYSVEDKEASAMGRVGWGMNLFPNNKSSSLKGGKSLREVFGKEIMDKTVSMMTMRQQKKKKTITATIKENENKSSSTSSIERRREQLREPGRISACDWRQNIINLPSSTILRDVRNPVTWVFLWATLWSIMYECLKRLAEASSAAMALSSGGGGRAALASTSTGLGPYAAARWLNAAAWSAKHMCLPTVQHTMMVSAVSLLLVFRTNSAYQRFAEGRKIWNDIVDTARDFSRMIKLYEFAIGTSKCRRINSLLASFPYLLRHRIRPSLMTFYRVNDSNVERDPEHSLLLYPDESLRDTDPELIALAKDEEETGFIRRKTRELCWVDRRTLPWKLIPGSALELCARAQNRPLWVCDRMAKELAVVEDSTTKFTNRERMALIGYVDKLSRSIGACERIHQTAVPMNYARHALRSLTVWLWTLPFVLVKDLGLLTGPVVAVLSWILFGIYEIGSRIEDPFQGSLRLSVYCDAIRRDVLADAIARDTAFILEDEGKSTSEKEGGDDAIFELDSESEEYDGDDIPPKKKKQKMWSFPGDIRL